MKRTFYAFLLVIATFCSANAQGFWLNTVVPNPNMPTNCAPTTADITGQLPATNYAVTSSNHTIVGFNITIDLFVTQAGFGAPVITPFSYSEPLGTISQAGTYNVSTNYYLSGTLQETKMTSFGVTACCNVNAAFSTNNDTLCVGDSLMLTNSSTNATSYDWKENGASFSTAANASLVFPSAGTYTITLVASDSCTDSTSLSIVVQNCCNVTSSFTTNNDTLCYGDSLILTSSSTGALIYNWNNNGGSFASTPTTSLVPTTLGPLTIELIASDSSCSDSSSQIVEVVDCCTGIAGLTLLDTAICLSDSTVTAFNTSTGADGWIWMLDTMNVGTDTNFTFTFSAPGTYQISLVTASGFACSDTAIAFVTVAGDPSSDFTAAATVLCVQFTDVSVNAGAWTWDFGDGNTDNVQSPQHCFTAPGTYTVCQVAYNGICTDTLCQQITLDTLVTGRFENSAGFSLFPNPAADYTELTTNGPSNVKIDIFDTSGRLVLRSEPGSITRTRLELGELPEGLYLLRISTEDKTAHQRLLIKR